MVIGPRGHFASPSCKLQLRVFIPCCLDHTAQDDRADHCAPYLLFTCWSRFDGSLNTSTSTLSPPPLSSDASGAAGRPLQSFLFAGRRFVLPTPHRCVLPTACSLVRPFVSSRILPQTPVVASVLSYLFLLSFVTSVSFLSSVSSRLPSSRRDIYRPLYSLPRSRTPRPCSPARRTAHHSRCHGPSERPQGV